MFMKKYLFRIVCVSFVLNSGCVKDSTVPVQLDKIISLEIDSSKSSNTIVNLLADGTSRVKLKAVLGENCDDKKIITFYTSNGEILTYDGAAGSNNVTQTAINKEASVLLKASILQENSVYVTAKVGDYFVKRYLNFIPANPDTFYIKPDFYYTTGDKINIDVELLRNEGLVSSKIPVYFNAQLNDTTTLITSIDSYKFSDNSSKSNPTNIRAVLQKVNDKKGKVKVKVACRNSKNIIVEKQIEVKFE